VLRILLKVAEGCLLAQRKSSLLTLELGTELLRLTVEVLNGLIDAQSFANMKSLLQKLLIALYSVMKAALGEKLKDSSGLKSFQKELVQSICLLFSRVNVLKIALDSHFMQGALSTLILLLQSDAQLVPFFLQSQSLT